MWKRFWCTLVHSIRLGLLTRISWIRRENEFVLHKKLLKTLVHLLLLAILEKSNPIYTVVLLLELRTNSLCLLNNVLVSVFQHNQFLVCVLIECTCVHFTAWKRQRRTCMHSVPPRILDSNAPLTKKHLRSSRVSDQEKL